jgi:uncharacterized repeat protein (TIGR03803 family)
MRRTNFSVVISGILAALVMVFVLPLQAGTASNFKVLSRFQGGADGATPMAGLILDAAGNLYGTTYAGGDVSEEDCGDLGCGTVFKLTPNPGGSWTRTVLYRFKGTVNQDGSGPNGVLVFDSAGNLYGTTVNGGLPGSNGVVFKLAPDSDGTWTESVLHRFDFQDGVNPTAGLVFDAAGNLFGTTYGGGSANAGVVFELKPNSDGTWTETVLHNFIQGTDGANPHAGVIFDKLGNLYGTTTGGARIGDDVVFEMSPEEDGAWTYSALYRFRDGADGANPVAGVIFDTHGDLYGTTPWGGAFCKSCGAQGCGVVFKLQPNPDGTWTESVIHLFLAFSHPFGGLIFDSADNLYGTAEDMGPGGGVGEVYKLTPSRTGGWSSTVVHPFLGMPAQNPYDGLVSDKSGNLYGTTQFCGKSYNCSGVVFEVAP